jgi:hypothetical protein
MLYNAILGGIVHIIILLEISGLCLIQNFSVYVARELDTIIETQKEKTC